MQKQRKSPQQHYQRGARTMSEGEWTYENLLSDNAMYRERIALLEAVAEAADIVRRTACDCMEREVAILDTALKAAGYLGGGE